MLEKGYSYLNLEDNSLNASTYNGTITRAEAIYTLVQMYYSDEYNSISDKDKASFSDAKNGGNIALKAGFITEDKETKAITYNKYWKSYELSYALDNADKGMPDDLYKALVVAEKEGIISGSESRWDEGITKSEALNFITKVYSDLGCTVNVARGSSTGENLNTNDTSNNAVQFEFEKAEEVYCQYETLETPVTLYAIKEDSFYGDPNYFNDELTVQGAYTEGVQYTFSQKTTYNGIDYYAFTNNTGLILLAPVTDFSTESIEASSEDNYEFREATDAEIEASKQAQEELEQQMKDEGMSDEQIDAMIGEGAMYLTPDMFSGDASEMLEAMKDPSLWTPEQLEQGNKDLY